MMKKKGSAFLMEEVISIIINVIYVIILITFVISKMNGAAVYEEKYSKEIALALDSAKPGMMIILNMKDAINAAEGNFCVFSLCLHSGNSPKNLSLVKINKNLVTVRLTNGAGYTYSFFNNVNITNYYLDPSSDSYVFFIGGYNEQKS